MILCSDSRDQLSVGQRKAGTNPWWWLCRDDRRFLERGTLSAAHKRFERLSNGNEDSKRKNKGSHSAKSFPQNCMVKTEVVVGAGSAPAKQGAGVVTGRVLLRQCSFGRGVSVPSAPCLLFACIFHASLTLVRSFILLPAGALSLLHISAQLHIASTSVL